MPRPRAATTDQLVFPAGAAQKSNINDFTAGTAFGSITIQEGGYTLAGNGIALGTTGLLDTSASGANTVSLPIALAGATVISDAAGNSSNALTLSGVVSGSGSLTKLGSGSVILTGANTYSGGTTLSGRRHLRQQRLRLRLRHAAASPISGGCSAATAASPERSPNNNSAWSPAPRTGSAGIAHGSGSVNFGASAELGINVNGATAGTRLRPARRHRHRRPRRRRPQPTAPAPSRPPAAKSSSSSSTTAPTRSSARSPASPEGATVEINGADYTISYTGDSEHQRHHRRQRHRADHAKRPNAAPVEHRPRPPDHARGHRQVFSAANGNAITVADADAGSADVRVDAQRQQRRHDHAPVRRA